MTDLTEKWKKGELPEGVYYCNTGNTVETLFTWGKNYHQLTNNKDEVYIPEMDDCEVLAPVPSYEEWKASYNCMLENEVLRLKLTKTEELLKEIYEHLTYIVICPENKKLTQKIKEVLK